MVGQRYRGLLVEYLAIQEWVEARGSMPYFSSILLKSLKSRVVFHPGFRRIVMKLGIQSMGIYGRDEIGGVV